MREISDRRGRQERGVSGLLERESALSAINQLLDGVQRGAGGALLIDGHAGMGKTRLHEAALDVGRAKALRVFRAAGAELEHVIGFGVARRLLSAQLSDLPDEQRIAVLAHAPPSIRVLAGISDAAHPKIAGADLAVSHGLFTVLACADETRPALIAIDDLHWCDRASLEFVLYLLHRLDELPLALIMSIRPGANANGSDLLDRIALHPGVRVHELAPLGGDAVAEMVNRALGDVADAELASACRHATTGNPFYLHELLIALAEERDLDARALSARALALVPDAVIRTLRVRVGRLGTPAGSLARAVAILGDDVPLRQAAALAGLAIRQAVDASDALASVEILLAREPLRFVHPLVRRAIESDIPASERASRHLDAARLLYADGAEPERVAAHLLVGRAEGNARTVEHLRAAAGAARARSAPQSAIEYLQRALDEPPAIEHRGDLLAELGAAEAAAGLAAADEHLAAAAAVSADRCRRAELTLQRAHALYARGAHERASRAYAAGLDELGGEPSGRDETELHDELQTGLFATSWLLGRAPVPAGARQAPPIDRGARPRTHGGRLVLARAALQASFDGERASAVIAPAEHAWDGGRLLARDTADGIGWSFVAAAMIQSGALELGIALVDAVLEDARHRGSPLAFATASNTRSLPRLWQGAVTDALVDLELARDARRFGWRRFVRSAAANYCLCMIELGEFEAAERALTDDAPLEQPYDLEDTRRLHALAELRLAQARPHEAFELALAAGETVERTISVFGYCPWRGTAALAAAAIGDRGPALELARDALASAERADVLHARIGGLRVLGLCEQGPRGLELLRSAAELGTSLPLRIETIRALVDLGGALRRSNQRSAAREPLQRAADLAHRGGARALSERARTELIATGARPRRELLLEGPGSLTPSERRIAELAARELSNRDIARQLFVTPKTVEYHLRNAYRKLGIERRGELAKALRD